MPRDSEAAPRLKAASSSFTHRNGCPRALSLVRLMESTPTNKTLFVLFLVRFVQRLSGAAVDLGFGNEAFVLHRHVLRRVACLVLRN